MKEFLEKTLRQNVIMTENKEVYKKLPLAYCGRYDIFTVETNGVLWMAIHPNDTMDKYRVSHKINSTLKTYRLDSYFFSYYPKDI